MKKIFLTLVILFASVIIGGNVFAYGNESYIHVEKATVGGYASGRDGVQSFASTQDVELTIIGNNVGDEINIDVFDANMDDVLTYLVYHGEGKQIYKDISLEGKDSIANMTVYLGDKFILPVRGNGVWLVHVKADKAETLMYVIRSKYGTVVKEGKDGLLTWVQDLESGKSMSNVPVVLYSLRDKVKKHTQAITDNSGIANTDTSAQYDVMIVGDADKALVPLNLEYLNVGYKSKDNEYQGQKERMKNFIFTDRPLYKPGDKVFFKAISRADDDMIYRTVAGEKWKVQIVKGWEKSLEIIAEGEYEMDSYGTITGELSLPKDLKTGELMLSK